jgi:2,6-dihydroxypseudooxynicotine hydrolase
LGPRFVTNGVSLTDFEGGHTLDHVVGRMVRRLVGARGRARGDGAAGRSPKEVSSAGEHLQLAGVYYHFGKFLFVQDLAQMKAAHMKAVECRKLAAPHLRPPGERVEMPYEGKWLAGILRKPLGVERPPVVAFACGLDSCKEETDAYEAPFLVRGMATLAFDGPGQGEGEYDFAIRGDYEVAVKAVSATSRRARLAHRGSRSWASVSAATTPRAAAFDKRTRPAWRSAAHLTGGECIDNVPI